MTMLQHGNNPKAGGRDLSAVYLNPVGQVGGAEVSMLDLLARMSGDGFRVTVILLSGGPLEKRLKDLNIRYEVCHLPRQVRTLSRARRPSLRECLALPFLFVSSVLRLRKLILREKPAVVISNGIKCHILSPFVTFNTKARLIWHVRDVLAPGFLRWWLRVTATLFCRRVITNSRAVAETIPGGKTTTIYNGIDLDVFHPDVAPLDKEKDLGLPADSHVIGTVGHLAPIKGLDVLIGAAGAISAQVPNAHFLIVGDAIYETHRRYQRQLRELVRKNGLEDRVHFLGFSEDVPRLLATFDLLVLPSRSEGFGRVVAEALAVGCPVVAAAVGGVGEVVHDGIHGLLVPPGDGEALAESVVRLLQAPAFRKRLAQQGRRRIREHFSLRKQASAFRSEILSALEGECGERHPRARAATILSRGRA